ncbi:discoidin domain-containing protein [Photobacterium galatheae]|uniref:Glycosyl hydrolase family 31 n=1 Tax=Photobacterium galatheae TaxID=1654360 RepID=A0A066RRH3_9GAMM|nr:discoidin domain-containing protein [Photobacterium galatheae]KDM91681.1 glycosyl hydrolase family 31 [Photobacterium galatheae]MCM0151576.1 discoidin domain-containing protein [Photobacterium galatheae]
MTTKGFRRLTLAAAISAGLAGQAWAVPLGNLDTQSLIQQNQTIHFETVEGVKARVHFVNDSTFRIQISKDGQFRDEKVDALKDQCYNFNCNQPGFDRAALPQIITGHDQGPVTVNVTDLGEYILLSTHQVALRIYPSPLTFALYKADNQTQLWQELSPIDLGSAIDNFDLSELKLDRDGVKTVQTLSSSTDEHFYGGGQQNGEFEFNGKLLKASYSGGWEEFDRPSPAPFFMSDKGYGVVHNTWRNGAHDFRAIDRAVSSYNEDRFDAYYFVGEGLPQLVEQYTGLTGRPHLLPRWAYYLGDADCYKNKKGAYPTGWPSAPGTTMDVVNQVAVPYQTHDMPVGWILPNDGYGCGYSNLKGVVDNLESLGIKTGLWTQKSLDQIAQEVQDGVKVYKLDVAWTGPGKLYSLAANDDAHQGLVNNSDTRGFVWTVMGWAGTQRYSVTWTGDQAASWDYIRWHIPTFIGSGLSGQAYASSDVNGIFGNGAETYTRDLQFKAFTPVLISMSGWDSGERKHAWWHDGGINGQSYRDINRDYLMLKSQLMPYLYNYAYEADRTGAPIVRAMTWEFPQDAQLKSEAFKYQYMYGESLLVAPVYEPMSKNNGWYKDLYLPEGTWIDFWDGTRTVAPAGGQVLSHYPLTIDRMPVLVRAGAIIPMYQGARSDALQPKDHLILDIYPSGESAFTLFEDDGETRAYQEQNAYADTQIRVSAPQAGTPGDIQVFVDPAVVHGAYTNEITQRSYHLQVHSLLAPLSVRDGSSTLIQYQDKAAFDTATAGWFFDASDRHGVVHIKVPHQSVSQLQQFTLDIDENAVQPETPAYPKPAFTTDFDKANVKVLKKPAEQSHEPFSNALDGDSETLYHSPWWPADASEKAPQDFVLYLGDSFNVSGFTYLPRKDAGNGTITKYRLYLSNSNGNWGEPVAEGTWPADKELKIARFAAQEASYLKFEALAGTGDFVSAREFDLIATKAQAPQQTVALTTQMTTTSGQVVQDAAVTGSAMQMNGLSFAAGLGTEAPSSVRFSLDGTWTRLNADVGIDDSCKVAGNSVRASIYTDGFKAWEYNLDGPTVVKPDLNLFGVRQIELRTEDSDGYTQGDCVNWANIRLTGPESATFNEFDKTKISYIQKPKYQPNQGIEKAFDGDPATMYHSPWSPVDASEKAPQQFVIQLGDHFSVTGFSYLARAGAGNGAIGDYRLSLSMDNQNWTQIATGRFERHSDVQRVSFGATEARYLKFEALSGVGDFVSAAEFDVFGTKVK